MKLQFRGFRALALGASALTSLAAGQAFAQQAASTPVDNGTIEEVVVTALKRSTTVQTTPFSISAVTEKSLQALGAAGIQDYFRTVPNLQVDGNSPTSRRLTLRGVRSAGEATVGLYYDETPLTGPAGTTADASSTSADVNLFDAERVEVLRGPQGTLYGSGSMGGTLRVILNKPDSSRYTGAVEAQGTTMKDGGTGYSVKGMVNVPLVEDKLAARESQAFRNSSLQGAYLMLAARALGLDCGPMSGFDNAAVDAEFFADEPNWKSNFICSIGYGDPASIFGRSPRPDFDTFNRIL